MGVRVFLAGRMTLMNGEAVVEQRDLPGTLGRTLFAILLLGRSPIRRSAIADALGRDCIDETFESSLNSTVSRLRSQLGRLGLDGRDWIVATEGTIELRRLRRVDVDVESAVSSCDRAENSWRRNDLEGAWADATVAYSVTSRPFLPNSKCLWVEQWQQQLDEIRRRSLRIIIESSLASNDLHQAEVASQRLIRDDPLREDSHRLLIRVLLASGDRARAKRALIDLSAILADELDVEPSPETLALLA